MRSVLTAAAALGLLCAVPAMAQTTGSSTAATSPAASSSGNTTTATAPMAPGAMQKDVKSDLEKAGFTDVKVMPSSFLVRAKDKAGRPVMMVINPDSVTEVTNVGHAAGKTGSPAND